MEARQAELEDVRAEQQAREAQAAELDRQIAESERRLQVRPMITAAPDDNSGASRQSMPEQWPFISSTLTPAMRQSMLVSHEKHGDPSAILSRRLPACEATHLSKGSVNTTGLLDR